MLVEESDAYGAKSLRAEARITSEGVDSDARLRFAAMEAQVLCCFHGITWHQNAFLLASNVVLMSIRNCSHEHQKLLLLATIRTLVSGIKSHPH